MVDGTTVKRIGIVLVGTVVAAALAVGLFGVVPLYTGLSGFEVAFGLLLFLGVVTGAARLAGDAVADYDVAEVEVDDLITRDGDGGPVPVGGGGLSADDVVEQIERADEDDAARALVVRLNTPGGAVVPSDDIRQAAADFDGPTVAYAEDMAASGGYWIASGCDEIHARRGSIVGSIGVNATQLGRTGLAEKVGLDYRRFVAGEYKDTPSPWRDLEEGEADYYQGIVDDFYDLFVETVAEGRDVDPETARETEARVYLGTEALAEGLVDHCGPREEMEDRLGDRIGVDDPAFETFEPEQGLQDRIGVGARRTARAFGTGVASVLVGDDGPDVRV